MNIRKLKKRNAKNQYEHRVNRKYKDSLFRKIFSDRKDLLDLYNARDLKNPACIIDANHNNSNKQFKEQIRIVKEVLHSRLISPDIQKLVKGVMIESYLVEGSQKIGPNHIYGKSITDPCLGWEDTEKLLYTIAELC